MLSTITTDSRAEFDALVRLLDDGDESVGAAVVQRMIERGAASIGHIAPLLRSDDVLVRTRVERIVDAVVSSKAADEFALLRAVGETSPSGRFPLARGCVALARVAYRGYSTEEFEDAIDRFARSLGKRLEECDTHGKRLLTVTRYFYGEEMFAGNGQSYYHPDNSFVNRVIETRRGIPISLAVIVLLVARKLRLPITPVDMPAHFLLRYRAAGFDRFLDPFAGRVLTLAETLTLAARMGATDLDAALAEPGDRDIIVRMATNALHAYERRQDWLHVRVLRKCIDALS